MHRFIIAIDVDDAPDLKAAYRKLYKKMRLVDSADFSWESTDEVYDGYTGDEFMESEVTRARMAVFEEENSRGAVRLQHDYSDGRYVFREFVGGDIEVPRVEYDRWLMIRALDKEVQDRLAELDNALYAQEDADE